MRRVLKSVKRPALGLRRGSMSNRQEAFICCCCKSDGIRCCDSHIENIIDHFLRQFFGARFALPSRMERTRKARHSGGVGMDYPEYDDGATCFPIELNVEQPHRRNCDIQNLTRATKKNGNGKLGTLYVGKVERMFSPGSCPSRSATVSVASHYNGHFQGLREAVACLARGRKDRFWNLANVGLGIALGGTLEVRCVGSASIARHFLRRYGRCPAGTKI
jgi:hypothetical protein